MLIAFLALIAKINGIIDWSAGLCGYTMTLESILGVVLAPVAWRIGVPTADITTFGGFLPLILAGGGFWPPFAMSVAGGVLLSTVVSFYFTPPLFALIHRRPKSAGDVPAQNDKRAQPFVLYPPYQQAAE